MQLIQIIPTQIIQVMNHRLHHLQCLQCLTIILLPFQENHQPCNNHQCNHQLWNQHQDFLIKFPNYFLIHLIHLIHLPNQASLAR